MPGLQPFGIVRLGYTGLWPVLLRCVLLGLNRYKVLFTCRQAGRQSFRLSKHSSVMRRMVRPCLFHADRFATLSGDGSSLLSIPYWLVVHIDIMLLL